MVPDPHNAHASAFLSANARRGDGRAPMAKRAAASWPGGAFEPLEPRLLLAVTPVIGFQEGWENAALRTYIPRDSYTLIRGEEGNWGLNDTITAFPEEGPTPHRAHIVMHNGSKALRLESNDSQSGAADNVWLLKPSISVPITPETIFAFEEAGWLDDPQHSGWGYNCVVPPCYDNISLTLEDNRGNTVAYILQRWPDAAWSPDNCVYSDFYLEVMLDPDAGVYERNIWQDFSAIPNFSPAGARVTSIDFTVDEHGWAILDNIHLGAPAHVDLSAALINPKLPAALVSGDGTKLKLPLDIRNEGNVPLPNGQRIDVEVYARPAGAADDSQDVLVAAMPGQSVSKLGAGKAKRLNLSVQVPAGLPTGAYVLVTKIDTLGQVDETDEDNNNEAISPTIDVTLGQIDLTGSFGTGTLPPAVVLGTGARGRVQVIVGNEGNVSVATGQKIDIALFARPLDGGADLELGALSNVSISGLKPGTTKAFSATVTLSADLTEGHYDLLAFVDANDAVPNEADELNNTADDEHGLTAAPPFVDLLAGIGKARLPEATVSGDGTRMTLPVTAMNLGNVPLPRGQRIDVEVYARPVGAPDDSQDVLVATRPGQSVAALGPGKAKQFNVPVLLPAGLETDEYVLVGKVDTADSVAEANEANNAATTPLVDAIDVTCGQIDLTCRIDTAGLPHEAVAGAGAKGAVPIVVRNEGNVPVAAGQRIGIHVLARSLTDGSEHTLKLLDGQSVSGLKPGASKTFRPVVELGENLPEDYYELVAFVDCHNDVPKEWHEDNNEGAWQGQVGVQAPFDDLAGELGTITLPPAVVAGVGAKGLVPVRIVNFGNVPVEAGQKVAVAVRLVPLGGGQEIELAMPEGNSISRLGVAKSKQVNLNVTVPADVPEGTYRLVATVDALDEMPERDEDNNLVVADQLITVAPPFVDLAAGLGSLRLPEALVSGDGTRITLPVTVTNLGNVPVARGSRIDIDVFARPAAAGDDSQDVLVAVSAGQSVSALGVGKTKRFNVPVQLPAGVATEQYVLVAKVDARDDIPEPDGSNNIVATPAEDAMDVTLGQVDLVAVISKSTLPSDLVTGYAESGKVTVAVTNLGNIPLAAGQRIDVRLVARPTGGGADRQIGYLDNVLIAALKPQGTKVLTVSVSTPTGLPKGTYELVAQIDWSDDLEEADEGNNEAALAGPVTVASYLIGTWGLVGLQGAPGPVGPKNSQWTFHANGTYDFFFQYLPYYDVDETRTWQLNGSMLRVELNSIIYAAVGDRNVPLTMKKDQFSFIDSDGDRWTYRRM